MSRLLLCLALPLLTACPAEPDAPVLSSMDSRIVEENGLGPSLVCPGAQGCETAEGDLLAGAGARTITPLVETWEDLDDNGRWDPEEPFDDLDGDGVFTQVYMAGFNMGRAATDVHDDNWARAIVLEKGETRVGMVALDLVGLFQPDAMRIRLAAAEAGLDLDHILVASTHQHEGKDTMGLWGPDPSTTGYDELYMQQIAEASVAALQDAQADRRRASLRVAQTDAPHLVADSRDPQVIDPTISGVQFLDDDEQPFIHLVVWGNHPESLGGDNTLITSDYPHYLREHLETSTPGSTAVFFAGSLGGLMNPLGRVTGCPDAEGNDTCPVGQFERAAYIGEGVAGLIQDAWSTEAIDVDPAAAELSFRRHSFLVRGTNQVFLLAFKLGLVTRHAYTLDDQTRVDADRLREVPLEDFVDTLAVGTEVGSLRIGPLEIVAVPGELYPELWLANGAETFIEHPENADFPDAEAEQPLQLSMPEAPMRAIINNANDSLGYIIPKSQFDSSAPFAYDPEGQYGEQNSLGEEAAPAVTQAVQEMYALVP